MNGIDLIARERNRQIQHEGWDANHDEGHDAEELAEAAACYIMPARARALGCTDDPFLWPGNWDWKPTSEDRIRELVKGGALAAAEIDRLQREAADEPGDEGGV